MTDEDLSRIPTAGRLKQLAASYGQEVLSARERGRHVAYVTAVYPVEILRAMGVLPFYPENYAVVCAARKQSVAFSDLAERQGYTRDLCTYALCGMGSLFLEGENPLGPMPRPDFLLPCNTQCGTLTKWFEAMGKLLNLDVLLLDMPFVRGETPYEHCLEYVEAQLRELVDHVARRTGAALDLERLREVMDLSDRACRLWNDVLDLARHEPAPWTAFDEYFHMAPIVTHRGTAECVDYYQELKDFLQKRVEAGFAAVPGEKYRFYWDNIPLWFRLREQHALLSSYGIVLLASLYTHSWTYRFDPSDPLRSLAENYLMVFCNRNIETRANLTEELMKRYKANGFIFHSNRSCKSTAFGARDIMSLLTQRTGLPGLLFDADMGDPRFFSEEQFRDRLEMYLELVDAKS